MSNGTWLVLIIAMVILGFLLRFVLSTTAIGHFWLAMIVLILLIAFGGLFTQAGRDRSPAVWIYRFFRGR